MTRPFFPFDTTTQQAWQQAFCSPYQAQAAYWQTLSGMMQNRFKTAQKLGTTGTQVAQLFAQCQTPADYAEVCTAWWGQNASDLANLQADMQSAGVHLWEQWKQCFPHLDRAVWEQQYKTWQQYTNVVQQQVQGFTSQAAAWTNSQTQAFTAQQAHQMQTATQAATSSRQPTTATGKNFNYDSKNSSGYTYVPGTFISGRVVQQAAGPTVAGTAPRNVAKAADVQISHHNQAQAETALADNVLPLASARTRQTVQNHTSSLAAASARRSVVAKRASKGRRVAR